MRIVSKISHIYHYHLISHGSQRHVSATTVVNKAISKLTAILIKLRLQTSNAKLLCKSRSRSTHLSVNDAAAYLSTTHISTPSLSIAATSNILTTTVTNNLSKICSSNTAIKPSSDNIKKF
ncbi:hypothetical protein G9A89_008224 [Geosiphon pyriformis]|nr:hypothetical protein G9A89_008224 [Geosiphon pyriformis]